MLTNSLGGKAVFGIRAAAFALLAWFLLSCGGGSSYPYADLKDLSSQPAAHLGNIDTAGHPVVEIQGNEAKGSLCPTAVDGADYIEFHQSCPDAASVSDNQLETVEVHGHFTEVNGKGHLEAKC